MLQSGAKERIKKKNTNTPLQKKVTFCGPIMATKGDKLRNVGTKKIPRKRTLLSSPLKSSLMDQVTQPVQHMHLQSASSEINKPHSKTTVIGIPTKTRLNCNHLRPKCQCSVIDIKKRVNKERKKSGISDMPRRMLISTRSLPRGEMNGRKNYKETHDCVSILDGNWRPGVDAYSNNIGEEALNAYSKCVRNNGNTQENKENSKKKVQFSEKSIKQNGSRKVNNFQLGKNINTLREIDSSQDHSQNDSDCSDFSLNNYSDHPNSSSNIKDQSQTLASPNYQSQPGNDLDDSDNAVKFNRERKTREEYCRLCDLPRYQYPHTSLLDRMTYKSDAHHDKDYLLDPIQYLSKYESEEPCLLCRRYGGWHYFNDENFCELCERHKANSHTPSDLKDSTKTSLYETGNPVQKKLPSPMLHSDSEEEPVFTKRIPYEPRTELVKNLKQKLEEDYRNDEHLSRTNHFRRRWRSWDAMDLEASRHSRLHGYHKAQDYVSCNKCVHHYLQNERLFLEPTLTNRKGQSVCVQCGSCQPSDPVKDPFLYHITLGEMKNFAEPIDKSMKLADSASEIGTNYHPSKRPGDQSKHLYATLNKAVGSILPGSSGYKLHPRVVDKIKYGNISQTKRHPNRSMALLDHLA
ncbi:uncharacterized protein [Procambarus clarkii]|uniref:uncharacterized protein n=1 Tax=Procambarus clarkii TaxID=6728 RepID=UPI0037423B7C